MQIIERRVCISHRDVLHRKPERKKPVCLIFSVNKLSMGYMAYVHVEYTEKKAKKIVLTGNSMRNMGTLSKQALLMKIDSYKGLDEVQKDFMI